MISYELSSITFNRSPPTTGQANLFWDHEGEYKEKSFANSKKKINKRKSKAGHRIQEVYIWTDPQLNLKGVDYSFKTKAKISSSTVQT